mmetsp:Transcript_10463/g.22154  ORF Transcript_10463/g.22154 Transcript_10463/m.22154 type:complete len:241 (+) Transcript_10463:926-1648(+)
MTKAVDKLYSDNFGIHHLRERLVSVARGFLFWHFLKYLLIVKCPQPQPVRNVQHSLIRRKHQNLLLHHIPEPSRLRRTNEIYQQIALPGIAHHHDHGIIAPGTSPRHRLQSVHRALQPLKVRLEQLLILIRVTIRRSGELILSVRLQPPPHGSQRQRRVQRSAAVRIDAHPSLYVVRFVIPHDGGALFQSSVRVGEDDVETSAVFGGVPRREDGQGWIVSVLVRVDHPRVTGGQCLLASV